MENILKIGEKITDLSSEKRLLRMHLLEVYWSPVIGLILILCSNLLPSMPFLVPPAIVFLILYSLYAIRFIHRFLKLSGMILTNENLLTVGGFPERVRKIIPLNAIEKISVTPNTIMGKCYSNTLTIETRDEVLSLRGYTNSMNLKNRVEKIQEEQ